MIGEFKKHIRKVCMPKEGNTDSIFEPSHADDYGYAEAATDALLGNKGYYFREVVFVPPQWWRRFGKLKRTGRIWQPADGEFFICLLDIRNGEIVVKV